MDSVQSLLVSTFVIQVRAFEILSSGTDTIPVTVSQSSPRALVEVFHSVNLSSLMALGPNATAMAFCSTKLASAQLVPVSTSTHVWSLHQTLQTNELE